MPLNWAVTSAAMANAMSTERAVKAGYSGDKSKGGRRSAVAMKAAKTALGASQQSTTPKNSRVIGRDPRSPGPCSARP